MTWPEAFCVVGTIACFVGFWAFFFWRLEKRFPRK